MTKKCPLISSNEQLIACLEKDCVLYLGESCSIPMIAENLKQSKNFLRVFNAMTDQLSYIRVKVENSL